MGGWAGGREAWVEQQARPGTAKLRAVAAPASVRAPTTACLPHAACRQANPRARPGPQAAQGRMDPLASSLPRRGTMLQGPMRPCLDQAGWRHHTRHQASSGEHSGQAVRAVVRHSLGVPAWTDHTAGALARCPSSVHLPGCTDHALPLLLPSVMVVASTGGAARDSRLLGQHRVPASEGSAQASGRHGRRRQCLLRP